MKTFFYNKTLIALAVAMTAAAASISQAQDQPMPPPATASALPPNIDPASPLAQVVKLVQAGVDAVTIKNFIANSSGTFNLDAERIINLNDAGVPADIIDAMVAHDRNLAPPGPAAAPSASVAESAPPTEVTVNYFNDTLTPYGSWVEIEGYGRCWRPTTVIYDSTWQPYCDRGHWVYSDCGWYWDSDYSWGATFHYGRWFRHARYGWCWWPDTVWAPSWVTWRSGGDYCGWAPLPPLTVYRPGIGFLYRGASVSVGFDFGLDAGCFTFVSSDHFCERHPRYFRADHDRVTQIFHQTTVINNYNYNDHNRTMINGGISVDRINRDSHHSIQPVAVAQIPNAGRQGWRGNAPAADHGGRNNFNNNGPLRHDTGIRNDPSHPAPASRPTEHGYVPPTSNHHENEAAPARPQSPAQPGTRPGSHDDSNRNATPPASSHSAPGTPFNHGSQRNDSAAGTGAHSPPMAATPPMTSVPTVTRMAPPAAAHGSPPANNGSQNRNLQPQPPPVISAPAGSHPAPPAAISRNEPPQSYSGGAERRYGANPPAAPEHSQPGGNWQQNHNSQPQSQPVINSPRNSTAAAPSPAQSSSHGSDRSSDNRDRSNH